MHIWCKLIVKSRSMQDEMQQDSYQIQTIEYAEIAQSRQIVSCKLFNLATDKDNYLYGNWVFIKKKNCEMP